MAGFFYKCSCGKQHSTLKARDACSCDVGAKQREQDRLFTAKLQSHIAAKLSMHFKASRRRAEKDAKAQETNHREARKNLDEAKVEQVNRLMDMVEAADDKLVTAEETSEKQKSALTDVRIRLNSTLNAYERSQSREKKLDTTNRMLCVFLAVVVVGLALFVAVLTAPF